MAENQVKFGILGCATIARKVARGINLAPNSTVYAIASRSLEKAKQFATTNGLPDTVKLYGSYEELLDDPSVDAVYMPLPTSLHVEWAVLTAQKKKHLLLEKPPAIDVGDLDKILEAFASNGVQFMDGTMWLHHPRTAKMKELIFGSKLIGPVNLVHSIAITPQAPDFLENDIRVTPDLEPLGVLGDLGWYSIGAVLWAKDYELPNSVSALPDGLTKNSAGAILSCTASLQFDNLTSIIHCSFVSHTTTDLTILGTNGRIQLRDFIIPYQENSASFDLTLLAKLLELHVAWTAKPEKVVVANELPQEALMVQELARLVQGIQKSKFRPDGKWPEITRKTQTVLDAVKKSIDIDCKPVYL